MRSILEEGLQRLQIDYTEGQFEQCLAHCAEVERWNRRYALVNASGDDLIIRHLLDSLAGLKKIRSLGGNTLGDIGSGGGFPGIPLSIFLPETAVYLLDRSERKCLFLKNVVLGLGIQNAKILQADYTRWNGCFDTITYRALGSVSGKMISRLRKIMCPGGNVCAYKGKRETAVKEMNECRDFVPKYDILQLEVPFLNEERHLILISGDE
ncbi:MAG: 16S rRNA (guanine(527)-N(7))-methyltransferase RsmG [Spirochaetia bacterium]